MVVVLVHLGGAPGPGVPGAGAGGEGLTIDDEGELTRLARLGGAVHTGHGGGRGAGGGGGGAAAAWGENIRVRITSIEQNVKDI